MASPSCAAISRKVNCCPRSRSCAKCSASADRDAGGHPGPVGEGLVESKSKIGTRVRSAENWNHLDTDVLRWQMEVADTDTYLRKVFELRNATEPGSGARRTAATAEDQDRIRAAFDDMIAAGSDSAKWVAADLRFHKAIYLATHNEYFWPIGQMFGITLEEMFTIAARGRHRPRAAEEHRNLLNAIIDRKADEAASCRN